MLSSGNSHCGETLDKAYFSTKGTTVHPVAQAKAVQSALISYFPSLSTSIQTLLQNMSPIHLGLSTCYVLAEALAFLL